MLQICVLNLTSAICVVAITILNYTYERDLELKKTEENRFKKNNNQKPDKHLSIEISETLHYQQPSQSI